jgi:O-antigen biosynthesis protein
MIKLLLLLFTDPARFINLFTLDNFRRLWFYLSTLQFSLLFDRAKLIHKIGPVYPTMLALYSPEECPRYLEFPRVENTLVSIIIPVLNHWETTRSCLKSILDNSGEIPYEVIIADDASDDETHNIKNYVYNIKVVRNETNQGFLINCNNAALHANGKYLVFLNNDTIVQNGWLKHLFELMEHNDSIGMAGSKLLYPDGRLQEAGGIIWRDGTGCNYGRSDSPGQPEYNYLREVDYVSGASMMVRKSLWREIGGFDKRFMPAYYEDTDLAFEIRKRGYKVIYQPLSIVVHIEGYTHGKDIRSGLKAYQVSNQVNFREKWHKVLETDHFCGTSDIFKARDHSARKKTLLFIDHYVPFYDQDAGSKATFQYLQLMVEMGYNIKFLGDNFVNHEPYTSVLQQMGIEVLYGPWYQRNWKKWIVCNGKNIDYIYLSRPHITRKYLNFIKKHTSSKLIYCGHDLTYLREARRYLVKGKKSLLRSSKKWEQIELDIVRNVDVSYFFSTFELQKLQESLPESKVRVIPIFLFNRHQLYQEKSPDFSSRSGLMFVGGFTHDPNVDAVLWFVREVFPIIKTKVPGIELIIIGSNPPPEIVQLSVAGVTVAGRLSEEELQKQYRLRRLAIAPLRYGAGVKGKIVEAMYYSLPTVTTSVGAEGINDAEQALFIADDTQTFADHVIRAYTDPDIWDKAVQRLPHTVRRYFSKSTAREILAGDMPPS